MCILVVPFAMHTRALSSHRKNATCATTPFMLACSTLAIPAVFELTFLDTVHFACISWKPMCASGSRRHVKSASNRTRAHALNKQASSASSFVETVELQPGIETVGVTSVSTVCA
eukprot:1805429-Pleurochrysis_carterae.AAC.1